MGSEVQEADTSKSEEKTKSEIKSFIDHHLDDSYSYTIWHAMGIEFPLPVILVDEGLHVFSSSKFYHGESVAESNGKFYALYHNKIYRTNAAGDLNFDEDHHPTNVKPLDLSITKNVMTIMLFSIFIFFLFRSFAKSYEKSPIPNKIGRFMEPLVLFIRDEIAIPNIGEKHYQKYMSYLLTVFFFIWFINLAGLTPLGINVTGNIAITFCLALITFLITQFTSKKDYWMHIFWMPGVPTPMKFILAPIELLGVFIKPFALMIRLYANMSAGHIVLMSLIGLLYIFDNWLAKGAFFSLTLFLSIIELLVAFLQAYIFTMLTALYFGGAVAEHEHHD
ncbi:MAG: F0F1 ATP synthase subunit A [Vicingaceae bacterium]